MVTMAHWAVIIPAERWAEERLFHHDTLTVAMPSVVAPAPGDDVLLIADDALVAIGRVALVAAGALEIRYTRRAFDEPVPAEDLKLDATVTGIETEVYERLATRLGGTGDRTTWLVSVALPIEAATPAEAVRQFWSHVVELGPAELPTFVSPSGDELAMQAFVLGEQANQDPEEDEDDD